MALIEIDGLPGFTVLKNGGSFHGYVKEPNGIHISVNGTPPRLAMSHPVVVTFLRSPNEMPTK